MNTVLSKKIYNVLVKGEGDGDLIAEMAVAAYNMAEVFRFIADECEFSRKSMRWPCEIYITPGEIPSADWDNQIFTESTEENI